MQQAIFITGSSGIAEATARLAVERGHQVFLTSNEEGDLNRLASELPGIGIRAADLRHEPAVAAAFRAALEKFGRVDALFNVAGGSGRKYGDGPVDECSLQGWETTLDNNVKTMFLMCREAVRHWMSAGAPGSILNMSSVLAFSPQADHFATHAYAASKGAIISMSRAMAAYYAKDSIRVNVIAPGLVRTPMSARAQADEEIQHFMEHKQPLSRGMLDAADIARAALFLLGPDSASITGELMTVDGGWSVSG
jgi:NAD(P)-dependent dehydrogenase (short-subunit alcohol dehydrogenase family)